jgi:hypothetical protein
MKCPNTLGCPLFPLFTLKASLGVWQTHYCDANFAACERFKLAQGGVRVPPNLLPNGKTLEIGFLERAPKDDA